MMKKLTAIVTDFGLCLTAALAAAETDKTYTIGIAQFAEHSSLDNCREGLHSGPGRDGYVEGENVTFIVQNAQADMGCASRSPSRWRRSATLVCAIATPMAQAAFNACMDSGKPVIYTAVSDPAAAMLANDEGKSEYNVTGTCDVLPVEAQLKLIRSFLPEARRSAFSTPPARPIPRASSSSIRIWQAPTALRSWRRAFPPARTFLWRATPSCRRWIA